MNDKYFYTVIFIVNCLMFFVLGYFVIYAFWKYGVTAYLSLLILILPIEIFVFLWKDYRKFLRNNHSEKYV